MNYNKFCDVYDCSYDDYYISQAGGGNPNEIMSFYRGVPYQRGFNFFTRFGKKYGLPLLKYLGKKAFNLGKNVAQDFISGEEPKSLLKNNLKRTANETIDDVKNLINQSGKRRRRKKTQKKKNKTPQQRKNKPKRKKVVRRKVKKVRKKKPKRKRVKNIFDYV